MKQTNDLGGALTYQVTARCSNCGWEGTVEIPRGETFMDGAKCPNCAIKTYMGRMEPRRRSWWYGR